jgi:hypothetical protein
MRPLVSGLTGLNNTSPVRCRFLCHLLGGLLLLPGRATFRNLRRSSPDHEKTFSRWFAKEFDWVSLHRAALMQGVPAEHEHVLAFDPSFVPQSGHRTSGLDRVWNGAAQSGGARLGDWGAGLGRGDSQHRLCPSCGTNPTGPPGRPGAEPA